MGLIAPVLTALPPSHHTALLWCTFGEWAHPSRFTLICLNSLLSLHSSPVFLPTLSPKIIVLFFALCPPSSFSDPQGQIFIPLLWVLLGEPWGSQWDQFKKEALVSPPLLGPLGWLGPLARNLQAFDLTPTHAQSFCRSLALEKKSVPLSEKCGPHPLSLHLWEIN